MQKKIINKINKELDNNPDLIIKPLKDITIIFFDSLTNTKTINYILRSISHLSKPEINKLNRNLPFCMSNSIKENDIINQLNLGSLVIITKNDIIACVANADLSRGISEPTTEPTINGPKDAFNENIMTNLGLIKRRLKTNTLATNDLSIGKHTKTLVKVLYIKDIAKLEYVEKTIHKLNQIELDGILDSGYIKNYLEDSKAFPTIISTEQPNLVTTSLLEGKIAIMVDNSPFVLLTPSFFIDFLNVGEDYNQKGLNISLTRTFRFLAFIISIVTPGLYIAISTFNQSSIPAPLLINILTQRIAVPIPSIFEALMMLIFFEILREGDIRMPAKIGASISIVGALILGDAAVRAGITSPIMIIIIAITAICSSIFNSPDMLNALRWWRIIILVLAATSGLIGVYLGIVLLIATVASLTSNKAPYLAPFAPLNIEGLKDSFILLPKNQRKERNPLLSDNITRVR